MNPLAEVAEMQEFVMMGVWFSSEVGAHQGQFSLSPRSPWWFWLEFFPACVLCLWRFVGNAMAVASWSMHLASELSLVWVP